MIQAGLSSSHCTEPLNFFAGIGKPQMILLEPEEHHIGTRLSKMGQAMSYHMKDFLSKQDMIQVHLQFSSYAAQELMEFLHAAK